jgi:hypothetical protein
VGVAAHITAASPGGPRYDPTMNDKDRGSVSNGIWLCETCAKLIDSDLAAYPRELLLAWKFRAEQKAKVQIGRTRSTLGASRSQEQALNALKRNHKMRDDLHRDLLKSPPERMSLPRFTSRVAKFAHSEVIVHRLDDTSYPQIDEGDAISGWFKLEILDFYHGGIEGILGIQYVLLDSLTPRWCRLTDDQSESLFPPRFSQGKAFKTGKIPWRNILHYDMRGDEYYPQPHLYCVYGDAGMLYEGFGFFVLGHGYEHELLPEHQMELSMLLASVERAN